VAVLSVVSLFAAACSSGVTTGDVGTTLPAMNGTIKLDAVISPAYVGPYSPAQPTPGRKLVAVVLTVHNPAAANTKFGGIYADSKLIDSRNHSHSAHSSTKFQVNECVGYPAISLLAPQQSVTGCEVYEIADSVTPAQLKISGRLKAAWNIAASAIQIGTVSAPVTPAPTAASGPTATTTIPTPSLETTTTTTSSVPPGTGTATPKRRGRPGGGGGVPVIMRVYPPAASPGQPVTILGKHLQGATSVTFNGIAGTVTFNHKRELVVIIPAGASSGPIEITTPGGSTTSPRTFQVY
jgi:hypothetical protein